MTELSLWRPFISFDAGVKMAKDEADGHKVFKREASLPVKEEEVNSKWPTSANASSNRQKRFSTFKDFLTTSPLIKAMVSNFIRK